MVDYWKSDIRCLKGQLEQGENILVKINFKITSDKMLSTWKELYPFWTSNDG